MKTKLLHNNMFKAFAFVVLCLMVWLPNSTALISSKNANASAYDPNNDSNFPILIIDGDTVHINANTDKYEYWGGYANGYIGMLTLKDGCELNGVTVVGRTKDTSKSNLQRLQITANGKCTIKGRRNSVAQTNSLEATYADITIQGRTASSQLILTDCETPIRLNYSNLKLYDCNVVAYGTCDGFYGTLTVHNSLLDIENGNIGGLGLTLEDAEIQVPSNATIKAGVGIQTSLGTLATRVVIGPTSSPIIDTPTDSTSIDSTRNDSLDTDTLDNDSTRNDSIDNDSTVTDSTQTDTTAATYPTVYIDGNIVEIGSETDYYAYRYEEAMGTPVLFIGNNDDESEKANSISSLIIRNNKEDLADFTIMIYGQVLFEGGADEKGGSDYPTGIYASNLNLTIRSYSEDARGYLYIFNTHPSFNLNNTSLTIKDCNVHADGFMTFGAQNSQNAGYLTVDNSLLDIYYGNILSLVGLNLIGTKITNPVGGKFVQGSGIMTATDSVAESVRIEPVKDAEITPIATDTVTTNEVISTDELTNDAGSLNGEVIDNVYYSINNSGDDATQTGYYDTSDNSIVITQETSTTDVTSIASAEDPLAAAASSNYTGMIFQVPAGKGTVTVETQTYGTTAVAIQIGTGETKTYTSNSEVGTVTVDYDVPEDSYVYVYTTATPSAAKAATRAATTPENGAKIYSVKVKQNSTTSSIKAIENGQSPIDYNAPIYNLAGQRVGRDYKGIVIQKGKKFIKK